MYLARDMELGTFWAIKQLPLSMKKEAELLRRLNHSSLPRMTDYTEQDDKCYLVMEYIKGKSLNEYLKTNNLLSFEEILTITRTILRIFQYLHSQKPPIYYGSLKTREPDAAQKPGQNLPLWILAVLCTVTAQ